MFDFDAGKLLIIGVVALVFIPSKDLPRVLRQLGQFVSKMRRMAGDFQGQFMDAMREADMAELRKEAENLSKAAEINVGFNPIKDLHAQVNAVIDSKPALGAADAAALGAASEAAAHDTPTGGSDLRTHTAVTGDLVDASGVSQVADHGQGPERLTALEMASEADRAEALESVPRSA